MAEYKKFQELALYQAIEDLTLWLVPHIGKWPKWIRPTLGQETMHCLMNVLRSATTAYAAPRDRKLPHLEKASADLDLRCRRYIRYMDDWVLVSGSRQELQGWLLEIQRLLANLGLVLNPKTRILAAKEGVPFLGYRVWPTHRKALRANLVRGRRRLRGQLRAVDAGEMEGAAAVDSLRSWFAHLAHADTFRLRVSLWREARPVLGEYIC